jgi:hypothetical protein
LAQAAAEVGEVQLGHLPSAAGPEVTSANSTPDAARAAQPVCGSKPPAASRAAQAPSVEAAPVSAAVQLVMGAVKAAVQAMSVPARCSTAMARAQQGAAALVYGAGSAALFQQYAGTARALSAAVQRQQSAAQVPAPQNFD